MQPQQPYVGPPQAPAPNQMPPGQTPLPSNPYDFIVNPGKPPKRIVAVGNSLQQRLLVVLGGLLVLVILIIFVGKLLSHTSNAGPALVKVAQAQQELLTIAANNPTSSDSSQTATLSADHQNVAATLALVMASNQQQLLSYVSSIGYKYKATLVTGYSDSTVAGQLSAAVSNGNYDETYGNVVQQELGNYELALKQAYAQIGGPRGQALLSSQYKQAQLLLQQLSSPAS